MGQTGALAGAATCSHHMCYHATTTLNTTIMDMLILGFFFLL